MVVKARLTSTFTLHLHMALSSFKITGNQKELTGRREVLTV